ncbi:hypothetical protein GW17_00012551, partial [Ensete ventricosum]
FLSSFPLLSIPPASNVTTSSGRRRNGVGLGDAVSRQLHHRPVSPNYPTPALPPCESLFRVYSCIRNVLSSPNECLVFSRNAIPRNTGSSVLAAATRNPRLLVFLFFYYNHKVHVLTRSRAKAQLVFSGKKVMKIVFT